MFRKNDEARSQWSIEKVYECKAIQQSLIEDAYEMLNGNSSYNQNKTKILFYFDSMKYDEADKIKLIKDNENHQPSD